MSSKPSSSDPRAKLTELARGCRAVGTTVGISVPTISAALRGELNRRRVDAMIERWSRKNERLCGMKLEVIGREYARVKTPHVLMSNHQSNWDIIALFRAFPQTLRMVAKQEMRNLPLLGRAMEDAEFIFVDRGDRERARAAIDLAKDRIKSGVNIWIAPEGTRSKDGTLGRFKKGGFALALDTGAPILPCTVVGTGEVAPVGTLRLRHGLPVRVRFYPPISVSDYSHERRDELLTRVRDVIQDGLEEEKESLRAME